MTNWKNFLTRLISAIIALAVVFTLYFYLGSNGLKIIISFSVLVGNWELKNLLFHKEPSKVLKWSSVIQNILIFLFASWSFQLGLVYFSVAFVLMSILCLILLNRMGQLERIFDFQARSSLGMVYMGLMPAFIMNILELPRGQFWFFYLLAVVFCGDTLAYCFGVLFGKTKIMPAVSPKKTWQGALGGLVGSAAGGFICWIFSNKIDSLGLILGLSLMCGIFGQFGDFFESLLKRIANIKDSGNIMPGHGGVLDRVDGVLFASPLVLLQALLFSFLFS